MRKISLFLFLMALTSATSFAQVFVGGSLDFNYYNSKTDGNISYDLILAPEIGYAYGDNCISIIVGYGYGNNKTPDAVSNDHVLYIAPCYAYCISFGKDDKWLFDINTALGYERRFISKTNVLGLYVGPQLGYSLTPEWTIWGAFDLFGIENIWTDGEIVDTTEIALNWFSRGIDFGFYYCF